MDSDPGGGSDQQNKKKRISKADSKSERNMHMYCFVPLPSIEAPYKTQDPSSLINR